MRRLSILVGAGILIAVSSLASAKKTVLTVASGSELSEIAIRKQIGEMYEQVNPNVDVRVVILDGSRFEKQQTMIVAGKAPDILYINQTFLAPWAEHNVLVDLGPYIKRDKYNLGKLYPAAVRAVTYKNKIWAMPFEVSPLALLYNKDMFKRAGLSFPTTNWEDKSWNWNAFVKMGQSLSKDLNGDGKPDQFGIGAEWWWYWNWIWQAGGEIVNEEGNRCLMDSQEVIEAMQLQSDLVYKYRVTPPMTSNITNMFVQGKAATYVYGRWLNNLRQSIKNFEWDAAALPNNKQPGNLLLTLHYGISRQSKVKDIAWDFLKFLVTKTPQLTNTVSGMAVPVLKEAAESDSFLNSAPPRNERVFADALQYSKPETTHPSYNAWNAKVIEGFYPVFEGKRAAKEVAAGVKRSVDAIISRKR